MWLNVACHLHFDVGVPTPLILMLRPRSGERQWVGRESYSIDPMVPVTEYTDGFDNLCQRLVAPPGKLRVQVAADVLTADFDDVATWASFSEIWSLPDTLLTFLLPSRYCESDRLGELANTIIAEAPPGYPQVAQISDWVHDHIHYLPGSSNEPVSALEVLERRSGVCRDLAQLAIALCRNVAIPARLVVGYLNGLEPMDLHAWFEAFVGDRWYTFDPTPGRMRQGRVVIARGRDAADVPVVHQFGPVLGLTEMHVSVTALDGPPRAIM